MHIIMGQSGITEEVVGNTDLDCSRDALNLDGDMVGKKIRVYWPKGKQCMVSCYYQVLRAVYMQKKERQ